MFTQLLRDAVRDFCDLSEAQAARLEQHYWLLLRWNERVNLTRVTELEDAIIRHYGESLFLASHLPDGVRAVDVGSGAGFPGVPCAVFRPRCSFDLVESHRRKAVFLREATRDLPNVRVLASRGETLTEHYDWLVSRAVDPVELLKLNLSTHVALLIGAEDARAFPGHRAIGLPWGERRVLLVG